MKQENDTSKSARFEARLTEDQKAVFIRAAALGGHRSLTEFVIKSAQEKADAIIRDHDILNLTENDKRVFVDALLNPPPPNEKLKQAAKRYKKREQHL
ncbi:MAG: DUF1778 domain-containing protein [Nitrospinae bacterium]|nr:DUF1778 domain-containing protein [Nitrospinota bacterium]